jgi:hypothetical protein
MHTNNYKKHILKDPDINDIYRKCQQKLETIHQSINTWHALAESGNTYPHHHTANTAHQKLAITCELSKGPSMPYYNHQPLSVLEKSNHKLHWQVCNNWSNYQQEPGHNYTLQNPQRNTQVGIPNSHDLYSTITNKLQK